MLAGILVKPGQIELREIHAPRAGPGEVVVKIRAAMTCGTDLKAFRRGHPKMPMPTSFGHEFAGDVHEVGFGVSPFRVGDPVMAVHSAPCGSCYYCHRGLENLCESIMDTKILGAYAEYIKVPAPIVQRNMFLKPPALSYEEAAVLEPLSCVVYGIEQTRLRPDDTVLIIGAGAIGLLHLMVARAQGIEFIIVAGKGPERLCLAKELRADRVVDAAREETIEKVMEVTGGHGANVVFECTGQPSVWEDATRLVAKGGTIVLFGGCPTGTTVTYDTARLHYDQITLKGVFHFTPAAVRQAYELLVNRIIDVRPLITDRRPLTDLPRVFQWLDEGKGVKYALIP